MTEQKRQQSGSPRVSVIIPSLDGDRGGRVARLIESIERQSYRDFELVLITRVSPQGRAINQGAARARGQILVILDDDSRLADKTVFQTLVDTLDADPAIGMAGASIVAPPEATAFQRRAGRQFPRLDTPVTDTVVDSDFACHGCCALRTSVFQEVGGEREDIMRGLDPELRARLREAGYRVVLAPHTRIFHPLPDGWRPLFRTFFRNGYGSAHARKFHPDSVYETAESLHHTADTMRTRLVYRLFRFPLRLLGALVRGNGIRFAAYCAYGCGYLWGSVAAREDPRARAA